MWKFNINQKKAFITGIAVCFILLIHFSCNVPTYNQANRKALDAYYQKQYADALSSINKNAYLKGKHNKILYLIEKGKIQLQYTYYREAFESFEEADKLLDAYSDLKQRDILGNIHSENISSIGNFNFKSSSYYRPLKDLFKSPYKVDYRPTHYERILIHYYKAISQLLLHNIDEAIVEAKQLNLLSHNLDDFKYVQAGFNSYISDPLPQLIAGIIYELQSDENNAFIEYENAWNKYSKPEISNLFGITPPNQIKEDLINLSHRLDFDDRLSNYENSFSIRHKPDSGTRYAIILIDNGVIPFKGEDCSWYYSRGGSIHKGFDTKKNSIIFCRPFFIRSPAKVDEIKTVKCLESKQPQLLYNLKRQTLQNLNKQFDIEAEHHIKECFRADTVYKSNSFNKHSDTRNWQTLPESISYVKLPIDTGINQVYLIHESGAIDTIRVHGKYRNNFYYQTNWK